MSGGLGQPGVSFCHFCHKSSAQGCVNPTLLTRQHNHGIRCQPVRIVQSKEDIIGQFNNVFVHVPELGADHVHALSKHLSIAFFLQIEDGEQPISMLLVEVAIKIDVQMMGGEHFQ